jgi:6,7-dimethyl-8-ribityllumazine synthase
MRPRILIVEARFYEHISDALLEGATAALEAADVQFECVTVPGALEIPPAIVFAAGGSADNAQRYDGYVALGCVIRGETYHFDIVAGESARALMELGIRHRLCIGNGILTVENEGQALVRAARDRLDKGGDAARACLALVDLQARLGSGGS